MRSVCSFAFATLLVACATVPREPGTRSSLSSAATSPPNRESPANQIDGAQLRAATGANVEQALRQFRPEFLRNAQAFDGRTTRPEVPSVYVDGVFTGTTDVLRMIPVAAVIEVRRLSASAARDWFGAACQCAGGVLLVTTRRE